MKNFVQFYYDMMDLRDKLTKKVNDGDIVKLIKQNSVRYIRNLVYPWLVNSIEDLFESCIEIETVFSKDKGPRMSTIVADKPKLRNTVFEIAEGKEEQSEETEEEEVK